MLPIAILAGGYATRLGTLARDFPKCLIPFNGRPFVDWQLDLLIKNGYRDFVFCTSYKSDLIQMYLGDGSSHGINIQYSIDGDIQLGTGGAIQKAIPILGDKFGVIYGDSYLPMNYSQAEQQFLATQAHALMAVYRNQNQFDKSNVEFVDGQLLDYEKGSTSLNMQHIDYGLTFFKKAAFEPWADQSSFDLSSVCNQLAKNKEIDGFEVSERFFEIGSLSGIEEFTEYLRKAFHEL
jgi:N-acetyl-alpha-D-muramate 1-phosphate uridylyltransferase